MTKSDSKRKKRQGQQFEKKKRLLKISLSKKKKVIAGATFVFLILSLWFFWGIPFTGDISKDQAISTKLYDRKGKLIYEIYTDQRRNPIPLERIPDHVKKATIAIEDKDFYKHPGFSISGMSRALYKTIFRKKLEGGSTLTQQLVKNSLLTPERTIKRKVREFVLAVLVELRYPKDKILEMYLNQVPYGSTAYGIGSASELYFGKNAEDLTLAESSLLAGLTAAPTLYSPFGAHPEYAKERQALVLKRMVEDKYITEEEAEQALSEELKYAEAKDLKAAHFALWVKELLAKEYGDNVVEKGGLRVTTTLDLELQEYAQEIVLDEVEKLKNQNVGNGAALVTRPKSGEILAMVGSKNYNAEDEDGKVNIIFAKRQPGSSIKPLNYALAIRDGKITASTPLADVPTCFLVAGQKPYCPSNYDWQFHGAIQARFALGNSYNIPAVRVLALNGLENFIDFATQMGITTFKDPENYGLSLTLGGGEVMPYDMAVAFGVLANQGIKQDLVSILKVEDWKGKVLFEYDRDEAEGVRVLNSGVAFIISHILHDNNARSSAFGASSYLNVSGHPEVSVKTGTTNDLRDNWTVGYTSHALVLTWVGNNDYTSMSGAVSGVSGASPIWNRIMKKVLDKAEEGFYNSSDKGHGWPTKPDEVVGLSVCADSGGLPENESADCPKRFEYFLKDNLPKKNLATRQDVQIDRINQTLASSDTPTENIEMQNHLVIYDPLGTMICLTCPFPMNRVNVSYPLK